jgi:hypothetical protein
MDEGVSMQLSFEPARLTGLAALAVAAATVLSVGACSSSHDEKSPEKSSQASANSNAVVRGLVASVAGDAVQVTEAKGTATVEVNPSTKVTEDTGAQLTDVVAGNCLRVAFFPESAPGGVATAGAVRVTLPGGGGKCTQPKTAAVGSPNKSVNGTVVSLEGNTITVAFTDGNGNPAETQVAVTDKTRYRKDVATNSQAIAQNKCIVARGTKDGEGKLQAKAVNLGPSNKGKCPQPAKK